MPAKKKIKKTSPPFVITTDTKYIVEQSDPLNQKYVWSYEIKIENQGDEIVQLLNRFWRITEMTGRVEEIRGVGVVGLQPLIKPGKTFSYTSFCQLLAPQGTMEGHFEMQNLEDATFTIEIPKFILSSPAAVSKVHRSRLH